GRRSDRAKGKGRGLADGGVGILERPQEFRDRINGKAAALAQGKCCAPPDPGIGVGQLLRPARQRLAEERRILGSARLRKQESKTDEKNSDETTAVPHGSLLLHASEIAAGKSLASSR